MRQRKVSSRTAVLVGLMLRHLPDGRRHERLMRFVVSRLAVRDFPEVDLLTEHPAHRPGSPGAPGRVRVQVVESGTNPAARGEPVRLANVVGIFVGDERAVFGAAVAERGRPDVRSPLDRSRLSYLPARFHVL